MSAPLFIGMVNWVLVVITLIPYVIKDANIATLLCESNLWMSS